MKSKKKKFGYVSMLKIETKKSSKSRKSTIQSPALNCYCECDCKSK